MASKATQAHDLQQASPGKARLIFHIRAYLRLAIALLQALFRGSSEAAAHLRERNNAGVWDLDRVLFQWSDRDRFTIRNATESVLILGELGAAKTTASGSCFLLSYMAAGMGGLVCCVKPGDRELIEFYAKMTGREQSLLIVSAATHWRCNLIRYAFMRPGIIGSRVEQIVSLLMTVVDASERGEKSSGMQNDKFWQRSVRQLLRNAIEVCIAVRNTVTMSMLHEVVASAPQSAEQVHDTEWQKSSLCYRLIDEAEGRTLTTREQKDFALAATFLLRDFPGMPHETRGSILATYGVLADILLRGHMAELFDGETNFVPDVSFDGAIIVLDLPSKVYGQAGITVQAAFTTLWQIAAEQRKIDADTPVSFLAMDEAHELVNETTGRFLATSRGARIAPLLISQNLSNFMASFGGEAGRHHVESITGNIATKVLHANGHFGTNKWASDMISDEIQARAGAQIRTGDSSSSATEAVGKKVLPSEFTTLKKGGKQNNFISEAIVYQTGASFAMNDGQPFLRVQFRQVLPQLTPGGGSAR